MCQVPVCWMSIISVKIKQVQVSKLVLYTQSTSMVISGENKFKFQQHKMQKYATYIFHESKSYLPQLLFPHSTDRNSKAEANCFLL